MNPPSTATGTATTIRRSGGPQAYVGTERGALRIENQRLFFAGEALCDLAHFIRIAYGP
jgi:hypothetical protein